MTAVSCADNFDAHAFACASNRAADGLQRHVRSILLLLLCNVVYVSDRDLCCSGMAWSLTATFYVSRLLDEVGNGRGFHHLHPCNATASFSLLRHKPQGDCMGRIDAARLVVR